MIDCPPNIYQCSWNALIAADFVIIPVPPEDFGTQGIRAIYQAIRDARALNPQLRLLGQLISRIDRRLRIHRRYEEKIRLRYGSEVLRAVLPELSTFKVALSARRPVSQFAPRSNAAMHIEPVASEVLARIGPFRRKAAS